MTSPNLKSTAADLLHAGKGILAADESFGTLGKRFKSLGIPDTEDNRRAYRETLFTTPGLGDFISGVILYDETIRQRTSGGVPMPQVLIERGIIPGIKVDKGTVPLARFPGEKITEGLDGLRERLADYVTLGARFAKWRAVIAIGQDRPSPACIEANARVLAHYAALCQEAGLVPIVEPELLMDGNHTIARCEDAATLMLGSIFDALARQRVVLEEMLLKTGMILAGDDCPDQPGTDGVAEATLRCFRRAVPVAVGGIVFLSGGQAEVPATERLNAICRSGEHPWKVSFSYGRALQNPAMAAWSGDPANVSSAQAALLRRARSNSLAVQGMWSINEEK